MPQNFTVARGVTLLKTRPASEVGVDTTLCSVGVVGDSITISGASTIATSSDVGTVIRGVVSRLFIFSSRPLSFSQRFSSSSSSSAFFISLCPASFFLSVNIDMQENSLVRFLMNESEDWAGSFKKSSKLFDCRIKRLKVKIINKC